MRNTDIQVSGFDQSEWVYGDENQIKQVLINLIKNAIEAMPEGGVVEITKSSTPSHIVVHVTDSGPGIPDEVLRYRTALLYNEGSRNRIRTFNM